MMLLSFVIRFLLPGGADADADPAAVMGSWE